MIELIITVALIILGYLFGRLAEYRHYKQIRKSEQALMHLPVVSLRTPPPDITPDKVELISGNVVISLDYFKRTLAFLKSIFGGRITSYESLLDRARREAIIRLKQKAINMNASIVYNLRLETASISKNATNSTGSIEIIAYGTAIV